MDGLLIFDQQNDVIYTKFNDHMKTKLYELAFEQELVEQNAVRTNECLFCRQISVQLKYL